MIISEQGLRQALEQLKQVYLALASIRTEHPDATPQWHAVLAEGFLDQARELQREIDAYVDVAAIEEAQAELWLTIEGLGIGNGAGPVSVLTALLDALRKGVQSVAEFLARGQRFRRPTAAIKDACDLRVVSLLPGSLRVGFQLPPPPAQTSFVENADLPDVRRALGEFLDVAAWAGSDEVPEWLANRYPDPDRRRLLLNAVKPFVPRPRGSVDQVTLSGRVVLGNRIVLNRTAPQRIDQAIDRTMTERVEDHEGNLREIDLDNQTMIIRRGDDVQQVRCTFDESLLEVAKVSLDRRIKVSGVREVRSGHGPSPVLRVFRIDVLEDEAEDTRKGDTP